MLAEGTDLRMEQTHQQDADGDCREGLDGILGIVVCHMGRS